MLSVETSAPPVHSIGLKPLNLEALNGIFKSQVPLKLDDSASDAIRKCRSYLESKISTSNELFYGINTGFGSLCNVAISNEDIEKLQYNLVVSHAAGTGDPVDPAIVRLMLLLKIQSLSYGHSGVREIIVQRLTEFYNAGLAPVVFELGSLGASGDLAPLAHLSLPLIGLGEFWQNGTRVPASKVFQEKGWSPLTFQAKEALALLNGTQFSAAHAVWCLLEGRRLLGWADCIAAMAYDGYNCRYEPLSALLHQVRPHAGHETAAWRVSAWLSGSEIGNQTKTSVQDPYAFRCMPQVHGASRDAIAHVEQMVTVEINSVTDNPVIFPIEDEILSGGNFHAQPLALPLDYLALALAEIGSLSERRLYQLISGQRGLPPFLTKNPGLHSGLMIAQYTAASIVSQNKTLCMPASADSIVSCNGQEDHVSMAANAATKARKVVLNLERVLAIELMAAAQALDFRRPSLSSPSLEAVHRAYRKVVPMLGDDRIISTDIEASIDFLRNFDLDHVFESTLRNKL